MWRRRTEQEEKVVLLQGCSKVVKTLDDERAERANNINVAGKRAVSPQQFPSADKI